MITVVLLFSAPTSATICIRRNSSAAGFPTINCAASASFLRCLQFGFGFDDAGALLAHRLGLHRHHALHVLWNLHVLHFQQFDRHSPGARVLEHVLSQQCIDLISLLQDFVEIVLADHVAQAR